MDSHPNEPFERTKHEVLGAMEESSPAETDRGAGVCGPPVAGWVSCLGASQ